MKIGLISGGLFLASYLAVNRGFGPGPYAWVLPAVVTVLVGLGVGWTRRLRRPAPRPPQRVVVEEDFPEPAPRPAKPPGTPSRARKLF